jgi:hypothetical protein
MTGSIYRETSVVAMIPHATVYFSLQHFHRTATHSYSQRLICKKRGVGDGGGDGGDPGVAATALAALTAVVPAEATPPWAAPGVCPYMPRHTNTFWPKSFFIRPNCTSPWNDR